MGFVVAIIVGLIVLAAIGYAIIYAAIVFILAIFATSSLIAYAVLFAILGESNAGVALVLAIPIGIAVAVLFFKDFKGGT